MISYLRRNKSYHGEPALMSINNKFPSLQQATVSCYLKSSSPTSILNALNTPELSSSLEGLLPKHRKRLYPPITTLSMFLVQILNADSSCQNSVNSAAISRMNEGLPLGSTLTGAYCRARKRLPLKLISDLVHITGQLTESLVPTQWRWRDKRVHLVDGTTLTMPDTKENQAVYPQQSGQKPGLGFPICRMVGVICLSSGTILNGAVGPYKGKGGSEQALLRQLLSTFNPGDLILGDALYGSYFLLSTLLHKGVDVVFEQLGARQSTVNFKQGKYLGTNDHLLQLKKTKRIPDWMTKEEYENHPDSLYIREVKVAGKVLITTYTSPHSVSKADLKALYKKRWTIEVDLRSIKDTLGMGVLRCKTPEMNEKELWAYLLAYNLIRLLMVQAAACTGSLPRNLSFKHTLQLGLAFFNCANLSDKRSNTIALFALISQRKVGNRPGRVEPRAVKRRPKPYPLLMKIRAVAQKEISLNGHPKKLK
jgi:hypothetical protein